MADKHSLLKRYWGFDRFRLRQEEIIDSVLAGNDTLVLLPTGGGKSICYQLPALMMDGVCVVVSPLIALMKDQVQQLCERHLKAACIVSGMSLQETTGVLNNCLSGTLKFLYVSPERLRQRLFIEYFRKMKVCMIAVDEAHCVSQWGYDFRPPYLQIAEVRKYHSSAPLIALTATATPDVVDDIEFRLQMRGRHRFQTSFARPNLSYIVVHDEDKTTRLLRLIRSIGGCGIVYTRSRRNTRQVAERLEAEGVSALFYHAGLDGAERDHRQSLWMNGKRQVMVATNAFGMGIDKPDVHFVIHLDAPESLEAYFQEAGRAGRNGERAYAILICSDSDNVRLGKSFDEDFPSVKYIRNVYRAICNYYQIPVGSGADSTHDFDLERLCETYNLSPRGFYSACRFLEREGLVSLPEREQVYSTLYIPLGREELYRFQVDNMRYGDMLQAAIRLYPGLFTATSPIDERKLAARCFTDADTIRDMLKRLDDMHVVEYRPRPRMPQIVFSSARIADGDIYLGDDNYNVLKEAARRRIDAMEAYMACDTVCRSRQLLAYFGETDGVSDCGHCDVCRPAAHSVADTEKAVRAALEANRISPQQLRHLLENDGHAGVADVVRRMLDSGEIYLDKNLLLSIS